MVTNVIVATLCVWAVASTATAIVTRSEVDFSENPLEWLWFFLVAPFVVTVAAVGLAVLLVAMILAIACCIVAGIVMSPFRKITTVTLDGLLISQRVGGTDQLIS